MSQRLRVGLLLAVALLAYANTLPNQFTLDDNVYIQSNPMVTDFAVAKLFVPTAFNNIFRPLTFATFALEWAIEGPHPFGYHLVNLLLHALVALLLYLTLRKLLESVPRGDIAAFVAALLFAVHPLHTEAVASISCRSELLAMGFLLAAWLLHMEDRTVFAVLAFVLALLSKESALAFVPLVFIGDYARGKWKPTLRYASIVIVAAAYLGVLWKAEGGRFGAPGVPFLDNPLLHLPASLRIPNALRIAWKYVWLQVYPVTLSSDYSYNAILLYGKWSKNAPAVIGALLVIGLWVWAFWTRHKEWFLAGAIYLAGFAVTANVLMPTGTIMGERLAYLPSAGFCLLLALLWLRLEGRERRLAWGMLAVVIAAFGTRTMLRNRDWYDNFTLFSADVKAAPGSAKIHSNLGTQYYALGQLEAASREFDMALRIYPDLAEPYGYKALIASRRGDDGQARQWLEKALSMTPKASPNYSVFAMGLAAVEMKMGANEDALKLLDQEVAESPRTSGAWSNRAVIRYQRGDVASARSDAEMALHLDPSNTQARNLLAILSRSVPATAN